MGENADWRSSRYNFAFPTKSGNLLYNASSGATLKLSGADTRAMASLLAEAPQGVEKAWFPEPVWQDLKRGDFVVEGNAPELEVVRKRFEKARYTTPLVITVTTTMDCNLGCYYCYETRSAEELKLPDVSALVEFAKSRIEIEEHESLHVDWYGGEPLLNLSFLEAASSALQKLCANRSISYVASIISNGTCWPRDAVEFVKRHAIKQVQISFDGLSAHHNRRRRYREGKDANTGVTSFDKAVTLVDELVNAVQVDLRFNIDRENQEDLPAFIEFATDRGWLTASYPVVIQPARLASYSDKSAFMRSCELSVSEYDALRHQVREQVKGLAKVEESESPNGYPYPRTSVCAALARSSAVVGADAKVYRCGLQVGESTRAVGGIRSSQDELLPVLEPEDDSEWWENFDPTKHEKCSQCSFLPVCWGGCPKKHLEGDEHAISEQGAYWRNNLARLVASHVGEELLSEYQVPESLQFRDERY